MFGVLLRYRPRSEAEVTIRVDHPPLGPNWKSRESWKGVWSSDEVLFHSYTLDLGDGDPKGLWTITGTREGRHLFQVEFDVTYPTPAALAEKKLCNVKQVS